eukprot:CAMPEP_0116062574 /NCGR_PEP_ID=MMETSP0322-20121206/7854_1 /TAXON_ID=163516 /ORGANISM="Leptocylindrus danicus var. apora, Strain B651" /LENGTH=171 /DNA_ID=CAMNT_0003547935 /DNA_START=58 /DNA_END=573 /DNA_ORIENTATION=+
MSSDEEVTAIILRSNDGQKCEIPIFTSTTLCALRRKISKSKLGVEPKYQRLFYMGREFKTNTRSLGAMGFGNYNNYVIHLMSMQPKTFDLCSSSPMKRKRSSRTDDVVILEDDDQKVAGGNINLVSSSSAAGVQNNDNDVIELLDDDDDDIEVVVQPPAKRRDREAAIELL